MPNVSFGDLSTQKYHDVYENEILRDGWIWKSWKRKTQTPGTGISAFISLTFSLFLFSLVVWLSLPAWRVRVIFLSGHNWNRVWMSDTCPIKNHNLSTHPYIDNDIASLLSPLTLLCSSLFDVLWFSYVVSSGRFRWKPRSRNMKGECFRYEIDFCIASTFLYTTVLRLSLIVIAIVTTSGCSSSSTFHSSALIKRFTTRRINMVEEL